jgi:outer membrane protein assembly factor BamD (BamD/ComL family)
VNVNSFKYYIVFLLIGLQGTAFCQPDEGWLKRNWHDMNARFNGLYHARTLVNESIADQTKSNKDNFSTIISVFPYGKSDQASSSATNMDDVYKKASKVIKKHPNSKWVDNAWFLIGQSYFFRGEPFTAVETFQYVIQQYPKGEHRYEAKLWILMSYLQQEKHYDAESIMGLIKEDKDFPKRLAKEMAAVSAEIYIKQRKYSQAIEKLELALSMTKRRDDKSRYSFILGQLFMATGQMEKAKKYYVTTIKLNPEYELAFQSNLGLIKAITMSDEKSLKSPRKYLKKMLKDDKNIDYFDQIYYELANLELKDKNTADAINYYKLSAQTSVNNKDQKANSYLALATIYFNARQYAPAQKYFDSTAMFMSETHPNYQTIKGTQLVLTDLIDQLVTIETLDSLLKLATLPKEQIDQIVTKKMAEEQARIDKANDAKDVNNGNAMADPFNTPNRINTGGQNAGSWYFYNQSVVGRGANDFKRKWGDRPLVDYWRIGSKMRNNLSQPQDPAVDSKEDAPAVSYSETTDKEKQAILKEVAPEKVKYYEPIPFSEASKSAARQKMERATFEAGKIYLEDLKEPKKAKKYLDDLLNNFPGSPNEAEAIFLLNKIAKELGNNSDAEKYSKLLNEKYPETPYNQVLNNKEVGSEVSSENVISTIYTSAYNAYKSANYAQAKTLIQEAQEKYAGNALQAKFDLLNAQIVGKTEGEVAFVTELKKIVQNYPGTDVANNAKYTLYVIDKKYQQKDEVTGSIYSFDPGAEHFFFIVYDGGKETEIKTAFSQYNQNLHQLKNLRVNNYLLGNKSVLAIQSFKSKAEAEKYYIEFIKNDKFFKDLGIRAYENYTISSDNFKILIRQVDADSYSTFFIQNYIQ